MADAIALLKAMLPGDLHGIDKSLTEEDTQADAPWGFAVYRVSHGNDAVWNRMLESIGESIRSRLELQSRDDLLVRRHLVAVDHPATHDRLKPDGIRVAFRTWATEELKRNAAEQPISGTGGGIVESSEDIADGNPT
ncbi:hypothetical protein F4819DRAFT_489419 [Hypoxylon fuscum]|nr:hypothetical protein F4819DRAFT_489419 [Hypoxylon fuscum]